MATHNSHPDPNQSSSLAPQSSRSSYKGKGSSPVPGNPRRRKVKVRRVIRYLYIRFIRLRSHPRAMARGLAAGVFAGCYPLFGVQTILGISLAAAVRGNKLVAAAGTWISNPLTYIPIYAFNYHLGRWVLRQPIKTGITDLPLEQWLNLGLDITIALLTGSTIVGIILAVISYYGGLHLAYKLKSSRNKH